MPTEREGQGDQPLEVEPLPAEQAAGRRDHRRVGVEAKQRERNGGPLEGQEHRQVHACRKQHGEQERPPGIRRRRAQRAPAAALPARGRHDQGDPERAHAGAPGDERERLQAGVVGEARRHAERAEQRGGGDHDERAEQSGASGGHGRQC